MREDAEELRRRLYAPGASEADLERYRGAEAVVVAAPEGAPDAPPEKPGSPGTGAGAGAGPARRRRVLVPAVAVLVVLAAVLGVAVSRLAAEARRPEIAPTALAMTDEDRQDVQDGFADGDGAGIAAFLVTHRAPPALSRATRFFTDEHSGRGDATIELGQVPAEAFAGRATVLLVLEQTGTASWTAYRRAVDPSGEQRLVLQRQRGGELTGDQLTADTFSYRSGDRPVRLRVQAEPGARWGVAVVYSD